MKPTSPKVIVAIAYLTYLFFGMFQAGIGPVLSELSVQTTSSISVVGGVFTFLFLGSLIAQIITGPLIDRYGQKIILIISLVLLSVGIIAFTNSHSISWMFFLALLTGLGQGGVDMGANVVVADTFPKNNTSALNILHFFFGLGAFIGPALVGLAMSVSGSGLIVHWLIAGLFIIIGLAIVILFKRNPQKIENVSINKQKQDGLRVYLSPLLWLLGSVMLIYIGIEYGLGSWISNYMNITTGMTIKDGAFVTSLYWGALAVGRLVGAAVGSKFTQVKLLAIALCSSFIGGVGLFLSHKLIIPSVICMVWISFSYGTVIPTTIAIAAAAFPKNKGKTISILSVMGSIGGITLPWFAGFLLEKSSSLSYLWFVTLSIVILLIILFFVNRNLNHNDYQTDG